MSSRGRGTKRVSVTCFLRDAEAALLTPQPDVLVGRKPERDQLSEFVHHHVDDRVPGVLFVCGSPGTGKSLCVNEAVDAANDSLASVTWVNAMREADPLRRLAAGVGASATAKSPITALRTRLVPKRASKTAKMHLVVVDEVDGLVGHNGKATDLLALFEWPHVPKSRLVLIAIANTIDFPQRNLALLHKNPRTRVDMLLFEAYKERQLCDIVQQRIDELSRTADGDGSDADSDEEVEPRPLKRRMTSSRGGGGGGGGAAAGAGSGVDKDDGGEAGMSPLLSSESISVIARAVVKSGAGDARKALDLAAKAVGRARRRLCPDGDCSCSTRTTPSTEPLVTLRDALSVNKETFGGHSASDVLDDLPLAQKMALTAVFQATAGGRAASNNDVLGHFLRMSRKLRQSMGSSEFKDALTSVADQSLVTFKGKKAKRTVALVTGREDLEDAYMDTPFWPADL